uniref:C-type lectin domain-containing protein n=1 Tax=Esox lucius TaxID=8010 RepID=A0AAY5K5M0_ESOLU
MDIYIYSMYLSILETPLGLEGTWSCCYYISSVKNTWNAGRQDCLNRRADLVIINSREEQAFIKALGHRSWIGLTDRDVDGTWRWVDGTPMTTSYWINGEPNGGKKENCGENKISNDDPVMAWNDQPCDHKNYFICEECDINLAWVIHFM